MSKLYYSVWNETLIFATDFIIQAKQFNMNPVKADTFVPTDSDNLIT